MSSTQPPPTVTVPPPTGGSSAASDGLRRRPVPVNYEWHVTEGSAEDDDAAHDDDIVFEDEAPTKLQEFLTVLSDYVFWILLAYCACNLLLWMGERLGFISPHFEEWSPVRWWHTNPHGLQQELYHNATRESRTVVQFEGLKTWIESGPGGWVNPKLLVSDYLSERGRYDRRLEVNGQVEQDEILVRLPLSHVLTADLCQSDLTDNTIRQVSDAQKRSSENIEISPWTWIALYMIAHSRKGDAASSTQGSGFDSLLVTEYIDAALSYIPIFWDDDNLHWLNGTDLLNVHVLDVHAAIESEYHKMKYLVPAVETTLPIIEFKKWAMVVMSRGETVDLPDRGNKTRTIPQLAIMPLIDLVDHHLPMPEQPLVSDDDLQKYQETGSHTNISYSAELAAVVLRAREQLTPSAAVTAGYGVRSNADYLLYHGFTMPREWSDLTLCTQYSMIELPLPTDMPAWKAKYLIHSYRFAVPACPNRKSTPDVIVGAARFLVATEQDVVEFEEKVYKDPSLLGGVVVPKDSKFLHHGASEALSVVCNITAQPPMCQSPLSVASERAAWDLIKKQTLSRIAQHATPIEEDSRLLAEDDTKNNLSVNQRHAVIARREEKTTLRQWCAVTAAVVSHLATAGADQFRTWTPKNMGSTPTHPTYWAKMMEKIPEDAIPAECRPTR